MPYELVSRALAYVTCFSTLGLFATSMAIAAVNVGKTHASGMAFAAPVNVVAEAQVPKKI